MGFKTFNSGDILTASDVNAYLMQQSAIVCTSSTRPSSPVTGMVIVETDTTRVLVYNGSIWVRVAWWTSAGRTVVGVERIVTGQSVANNTLTAITWDQLDVQSDNFITVPSATLTVPTNTGGIYTMTALLNYSASAGTAHYIQVVAGGVTYRQIGANGDNVQNISLTFTLAPAQTVQISTTQFSGGGLTVTGQLILYRMGL